MIAPLPSMPSPRSITPSSVKHAVPLPSDEVMSQAVHFMPATDSLPRRTNRIVSDSRKPRENALFTGISRYRRSCVITIVIRRVTKRWIGARSHHCGRISSR